MKTIILILSIITTFLAPIQGLLIMMVLFILCDTGFGIYAAIKQNGIKSFRSTKLFNIVVKSFFYLTTIILCFLIDNYLFEGSFFEIKLFFSKVMTAFWIYIEIKSLDETSIKLGNKSFWIMFKEFINKLKGIKKDLNDLVDNDDSEKETNE